MPACNAKLQECDHKPMKVQVKVSKSDQGATLVLEDQGGIFLRVAPPVTEEVVEETDELASEEEEEKMVESLRQALAEARMKNEAMAAELQASKDRIEELWQVSCDQLTEFEATLLSKDREIALVR